MGLFLLLAYRSDRTFQIGHTEQLLRSMLQAVSAEVSRADPPSEADLARIASRLNGAALHRHALALVDRSGRVVLATEPRQVGRAFAEVYPPVAVRFPEPDASLVTSGGERWFLVGQALPGGKTLYLLMDWAHVSSNLRSFWTLHAAHALVTLTMFSLLLWIVTRRFVRTPLAALEKAIRSIETGKWQYEVEVRTRDEFGFIYSRFLRMGRRLKENVDRLVRAEKYAAAAIIVIRVGREMNEPLAVIRGHLERLRRGDPGGSELDVIVADLDRNWREMDRSLRRLSEIKHPAEWGV
jgi:hypothetical protein